MGKRKKSIHDKVSGPSVPASVVATSTGKRYKTVAEMVNDLCPELLSGDPNNPLLKLGSCPLSWYDLAPTENGFIPNVIFLSPGAVEWADYVDLNGYTAEGEADGQ